MKKISFILTILIGSLGLFAQSSQPIVQIDNQYFGFLEQQKLTAKDYIISLFTTRDIVIFSEGNHAEIEQYNLLLDVIKDPYFIENVGAVYLEVCPVNHSSVINDFLMHEGYNSIQAYEGTTKIYQLGSDVHIWNCHSYPWLIFNLYNLNQILKKEEKIQLYGCDVAHDWNDCKSKDDYAKMDPFLQIRDSIMAFNFVAQYTQFQKSRNGKKKALVIMNSRHGYLKDTHYSESVIRNNTGRYLKDEFKGRVASVLMMSPAHPNSWNEYMVVKDGRWDAYFELSGKTDIGFNLQDTPFGQSEFDRTPGGWSIDKYHYEDIYTGLVYYRTIDAHILKRGWSNAITDDFEPELIRRMKIMDFDDEEIEQEVEMEKTERSNQYHNINELKKRVDFWKEKLLRK
jgi:hypothetical protein